MEGLLTTSALAFAAIAAIVGDRLTWGIRPQGDPLPGLVFMVPSDPQDYTMAGRMSVGAALVQIDCWGASYEEALALKDAVLAWLDTLRTPPLQANVETVRDGFEIGDGPLADTGAPNAAGDNFFRKLIDVRVTYTPA